MDVYPLCRTGSPFDAVVETSIMVESVAAFKENLSLRLHKGFVILGQIEECRSDALLNKSPITYCYQFVSSACPAVAKDGGDMINREIKSTGQKALNIANLADAQRTEVSENRQSVTFPCALGRNAMITQPSKFGMNFAAQAAKFQTEVPGWLGSLVLSFDGGILFSAGDLTDDMNSAPKFVELARHLGVFMTLEGAPANQENPFKRFTSNAVFVVKRHLSPSDSHEDPKGLRSSTLPVNV
ncbi:hypothetical protein ACTXT7_000383 [Hymenolepis weldensis]